MTARTLLAPDRRCERCRCVLSSVNHGTLCYPCEDTDRRARRDRPYQPRSRESIGDRWGYRYDHCVIRGTTEQPHHSHGRCLRCRPQGRSENTRMEVHL